MKYQQNDVALIVGGTRALAGKQRNYCSPWV